VLKRKTQIDTFVFDLNISGVEARYEDGVWWFYSVDEGKKLFYLVEPYMVDANGIRTNEVEIDIQGDTVLLKADITWLNSVERQYPVTIDPSIELEILNVHSHPHQGDDWAVSFETVGVADLIISPDDQATIDDITFVSLTCDGEDRDPEILDNDVIYYSSWECEGEGQLIHYVDVAAPHVLLFQFGSESEYAYNNPTTYNFVGVTTGTNDYYAYEKYGAATFTGPDDTGTSEATDTDYGDISSENNVRWVTTGADTDGHYDSQLYKFYIDEDEATVTQLSMKWGGYGETQSGYSTDLNIWDYNASAWELLANQDFTSAVDIDLTDVINTNVGNYIDTDGEVALMVKSEKYIPTVELLCSDAIDNDGDSMTDSCDSDCNPGIFFNEDSTTETAVTTLDSDRFVVVYADDDGANSRGMARVGQVSGGSITWGTAIQFDESVNTWAESLDIDTLSSSQVIMVMRDANDGNNNFVKLFDVSGLTITEADSEPINHAMECNSIHITALNSSTFVVVYDDDDADNKVQAEVGTISGSTINFSHIENDVYSSSIKAADIDAISSSQFVVCYVPWGDTSSCKIGEVSGDTITFGSAYAVNEDDANYIAVSSLTSTKFMTAFWDQNENMHDKIGEVSGTVITFGSEYVFDSANNSVPITDKLDADTFVIGYGNYNVTGSVTGTNIVHSAPYKFANVGSIDNSFIAAFDSSDFIMTFQHDNPSEYGKAIRDNITHSYLTEAGCCSDGADNDEDGSIDGVDSNCGGTEANCSDGIDNDCDGWVDPNDTDCSFACSCSGTGYETYLVEGDKVFVDCNADKCWTPTASSIYTWGITGTNPSCVGDGTNYPACNYCDTLDYSGMTDWTLPDQTTLGNLCNSGSCSSMCFGGDGNTAPYEFYDYWSSNEYNSGYSWYVRFDSCTNLFYDKDDQSTSVRSVR